MKKLWALTKANVILFFCFYPHFALAQLSKRTEGVAKEAGLLMTYFLYFVTLGGLLAFVGGIVSMIKKKKAGRELDWEIWGIIGGGALAIAMLLFTDVASSISGETVTVDLSNPSSGSGF